MSVHELLYSDFSLRSSTDNIELFQIKHLQREPCFYTPVLDTATVKLLFWRLVSYK